MTDDVRCPVCGEAPDLAGMEERLLARLNPRVVEALDEANAEVTVLRGENERLRRKLLDLACDARNELARAGRSLESAISRALP